MKSFQQFLSENVNIAGDFNGNLYINGEQSNEQSVKESFLADVVWQGRLFRMEIEGKMPNKNELAEQLQDEYPGAIVHNLYPITSSTLKIKNSQRYQPERLTWGE